MDLVIIFAIPVIVGISYYLAKRAVLKSPGSQVSFENAILLIRVPKENEKDALAAEQMFASLHGLLKLTPGVQEHISFEIAARADGIYFYAVCPRALRSFVESQIYAQYPAAEIKESPDYASYGEALHDKAVEGTELLLAKKQYFPIRTFTEFEVDPLAAITSALSELHPDEQIWIQILVRPVPDVWQEEGYNYATSIKTGTSPVEIGMPALVAAIKKELFLMPESFMKALFHPGVSTMARPDARRPGQVQITAGQELEVKAIELKLSKMGFETLVRVAIIAPTPEEALGRLRNVTASFRQFSTANLNSFIPGEEITDRISFLENYRLRSSPESGLYVLNTEELASIYHLPSISVETPSIAWSPAKRAEPPLDLPTEDCTYIGYTTFREGLKKFGLKREDRTCHFYAVGKTGTGKSTLFKNMIIQDMRNGEGVGVMDPHGDLIEDLLEYVPDNRIDDVIIFDPSDLTRPTALNVLECPNPAQKNLMASGLVSAIRNYFENSWGPRLEYLLNNSVLTLLEVPRTTLLGVTRILADKNYQKYIVHRVKDPVIKDFWEREFKQMMGNVAFHTEAIQPIQNKIGRFLASSTIRNILGQAYSTIRFDEIMNQGKILFINLSKGKIGDDNANLLGGLIVSRLNFMAMQRVNIPPKDRRDFYFYVDEFQNFASGSFASILSEARKYRLNLHLTHQYTAQLPEEMLDAVIGNVGTMAVFSLGSNDAKALAPAFLPDLEETDLISLERHHIYIKMMIDGMTRPPFSAVTLPLPTEEEKTHNGEKVRELSRQKYGTDGAVVEERIKRWTEKQFDLGLAVAEDEKDEKDRQTASQVVSPVVGPMAIPVENTSAAANGIKTAGEISPPAENLTVPISVNNIPEPTVKVEVKPGAVTTIYPLKERVFESPVNPDRKEEATPAPNNNEIPGSRGGTAPSLLNETGTGKGE